ncbi:hypothetical protein BDV95DRAFT_137434 [Massariosphaeria phaeospora]|uniref:GPCPD1-like C2 domain-containing protein n=1 Tax=Massariosphaeria phaeospora TaxID=100035 RepID=A0A7C8IDN8_9PLEO|nr:hypothetical protein BDV95DRAFT_137434 [Massariosphaeria phaeospora]
MLSQYGAASPSRHWEVENNITTRNSLLHYWAHRGDAGAIDRLLDTSLSDGLNCATGSDRWTPLFHACAQGHVGVVKLLLGVGADSTIVDSHGWTAREYAVFMGHLAMVDLLESTGVSPGPLRLRHFADTLLPLPAFESASADRSTRRRTHVVINIGTMHQDSTLKSVKLDYSSLPVSGLWLAISSSEFSSWRELRSLEQQTYDFQPSIFSFPNVESAKLHFSIVLRDHMLADNDIPLGTGVALLHDHLHRFGRNYDSMIREMSVPIVQSISGKALGTISFTFVVAEPFEGLDELTKSFEALRKTNGVRVIGHRGLGINTRSRKHLQIGENTIEASTWTFCRLWSNAAAVDSGSE